MRLTKLTLIAITVLIIESCHTSKKTTTSTVASTPVSTPTTTLSTTTTSGPVNPFAKSPDGVYAPGNDELVAIKAKYEQFKDVTLEKLTLGHQIYTKGACIGCHGADNIYRHEVTDWVHIIDNMAMRARLSAEDKNAVFAYVISIKSAQPK